MQRVVESVFERFAFCIDEGDSSGTHIDPEMLGKVFESLMAEDERASSGSFYTPRCIVDVLVERAIHEWCGRDEGPKLLQRLEAIAIVDPACGSGAFLLSALQTIEKMISAITGKPADRQAIVERSLFGVDLKPEAVRLCELRLQTRRVDRSDSAAAEPRSQHPPGQLSSQSHRLPRRRPRRCLSRLAGGNSRAI